MCLAFWPRTKKRWTIFRRFMEVAVARGQRVRRIGSATTAAVPAVTSSSDRFQAA
jgi:hypothetical protein